MSDYQESYHAGYVVDASVVIKLFIEDPLSERAYTLFEQLTKDSPAEIYAPDLLFIECTNVMLKYVRWGGLPMEIAMANLSDLVRLGIQSISTADLMVESLKLAFRHTLTAYDACYVAIAGQFNLPFVTADEKLARRAPGTIWLGNFEGS